MPVQPTKAELEATPLDPSKFGVVCPKDPNRKSTDPKNPPTHLAADVVKLDLDERPQFTREQIQAGMKRRPTTAHLVCNTCGNEWTVTPWPPRAS